MLAVLAITSEYSTRMIRTTLAANPRRRAVLAAKTVVVGGVVLVVGLATSAACFQVGQWFLRGNGFTYEGGYPAVSLADDEALRAVLGSARTSGCSRSSRSASARSSGTLQARSPSSSRPSSRR